MPRKTNVKTSFQQKFAHHRPNWKSFTESFLRDNPHYLPTLLVGYQGYPTSAGLSLVQLLVVSKGLLIGVDPSSP